MGKKQRDTRYRVKVCNACGIGFLTEKGRNGAGQPPKRAVRLPEPMEGTSRQVQEAPGTWSRMSARQKTVSVDRTVKLLETSDRRKSYQRPARTDTASPGAGLMTVLIRGPGRPPAAHLPRCCSQRG